MGAGNMKEPSDMPPPGKSKQPGLPDTTSGPQSSSADILTVVCDITEGQKYGTTFDLRKLPPVSDNPILETVRKAQIAFLANADRPGSTEEELQQDPDWQAYLVLGEQRPLNGKDLQDYLQAFDILGVPQSDSCVVASWMSGASTSTWWEKYGPGVDPGQGSIHRIEDECPGGNSVNRAFVPVMHGNFWVGRLATKVGADRRTIIYQQSKPPGTLEYWVGEGARALQKTWKQNIEPVIAPIVKAGVEAAKTFFSSPVFWIVVAGGIQAWRYGLFDSKPKKKKRAKNPTKRGLFQ
jgi:hypothetical protein